ncbi:MAG: methyltransferase domain-containing protein, partial [Lentisphaeria bacterium]|nr:methyltransferase domain-containing protein [Lentisphaeria bacterium]
MWPTRSTPGTSSAGTDFYIFLEGSNLDKKDIIAFFDRCAPTWDAEMIKRDEIIEQILDNAEVGAGMEVLDVACGTGVMFDYYLARNVASVTGIDISPEMAKLAAGKYEAEE